MVWIDLISDVKVYYQVYDILKSIIVLIMKFMRISIPIVPMRNLITLNLIYKALCNYMTTGIV